MKTLRFALLATLAATLGAPSSAAVTPATVIPAGQAGALPDGFTRSTILEGLDSPASFDFAPDGRIFVTERVRGHLRVATETAPGSGQWQVDPQPYATFDVPTSGGVPSAHRSSGVRGFAFDPDFDSNGYVYVFYMKDNPRQNRVVRIRQDPADPSRALPGETLLLELPFNASGASGSHNGGALRFGPDGMLYITTGDGWSGGDPVQSLDTFTGKLLRIHPDGTIPTDNPFYQVATGDHRAIYALGLRNPYTLSFSPANGWLVIGEANGPNKADLLRVQPGANYRHQGYGGIGTSTGRWTDVSSAGSKLVTGGAWYPSGGPFPARYHGAYFVCLWGTNGANGGPPGQLSYVRSASDTTVERFQGSVGTFDGAGTRLKPVHLRVGPDGALYYLLTSYMTGAGSIERVTHGGAPQVAAPVLLPAGGTFGAPLVVRMRCATPGAVIRYTTDGTEPTPTSTPTRGRLRVAADTNLRARAFLGGQASPVTSADYAIGTQPNLAPVVNAGPDRIVEVGTPQVLNGAASFDPDGSDLNLSESWVQVSGPQVAIGNSDEMAAYFLPTEVGRYRFRLTLTDGVDAASDEVLIHVAPCVNDVTDGLVAAWPLDEASGTRTVDSASGLWNGTLQGGAGRARGPAGSAAAVDLDGVDDLIEVGGLDVSGTAMTITAWIQADDFGVRDARIVSKASGVMEQDHHWMLSTVGSGADTLLRLRLRTGGATRTLRASSGALVPGRWHFVAATYDGAAARLYLDGLPVGSMAQSGPIATSPAVPVAIGNQPQGGRPFDGRVDDVRIYSRALSPTELLSVSALAHRLDCVPR